MDHTPQPSSTSPRAVPSPTERLAGFLDAAYAAARQAQAWPALWQALREADCADEVLQAVASRCHGRDAKVDDWLVLGWMHLQRSDWAAALTDFEQAGQLNPSDPLCPLLSLSASIRANNPEHAMAAWQRLVALDPSEAHTPDALTWKAQAGVAIGQIDGALAAWRAGACQAQGPDAYNARMTLARALLDAQRTDEALEVLAPGSQAYPKDERLAVALLLEARARLMRQEWDEAAKLLEQARPIPCQPDTAAYAHFFSAVVAQVFGRWDDAASDARAAIPILQGDDKLHVQLLLARVCNQSGHYQDTLDTLRTVDLTGAASYRHAEALFHRGVALLHLNQAQSAVEALQQAQNTEGSEELRDEGMYWIARAQQALGQSEAALASLAQMRSPVPEPLFSLAGHTKLELLLSADKLDQAMAVVDQLLEQAPSNPILLSAKWNIFTRQARLQDAWAWLQTLSTQPGIAEHPYLALLRSETQRRLKHYENFIAELRQATQVPARYEQDAWAWYAAATGFIGLAQIEQAGPALEKIDALDPSLAARPEIKLWKSATLLHTGSTDGAQTALALLDDIIPQLEGELLAFSTLCRGHALALLKDYAKALPVFEQAAEQLNKAGNAEPAILVSIDMLRAASWIAQGDKAQALRVLDNLLDRMRDVPLGHELLAMAALTRAALYADLGRFEEALAATDAASVRAAAIQAGGLLKRQVSDLPERLNFLRGHVLFCLRRHEEALAAFAPLANHPTLGYEVCLRQGHALIQLEDFAAALAAYTQALRQAADGRGRGQARRHQGHAWLRLRDDEGAVHALREAIAADDEAIHDWRVWLLLGEAQIRLNRLDAAESALRRAWTLRPKNHALKVLACALSALLIRLERPEEALTLIDDARGLGVTAAELDHNKGLAELELFRKDRSPAHLEHAKSALRKASEAGIQRATDTLRQLEQKAPTTSWFDFWFGAQAGTGRKAVGATLLALVAAAVVAAVVQGWRTGNWDWKALLAAAFVAAFPLLLPGMRNLSLAWGDLKVQAEPIGAEQTGSKNVPTVHDQDLFGGDSWDLVKEGSVLGVDVLSSGIALALKAGSGHTMPPALAPKQTSRTPN